MILPLLCLLLPVPQTVSHTFTSTPTGLDLWNFTVPEFDPALGTLLSVDVTGTVTDDAWVGAEFQCSGMGGLGSLTFSNHSFTRVRAGEQSQIAGSGGTYATVTAHNDYDGTTDLAGRSGQTRDISYAYPLAMNQMTDAPNLADFTGTGTEYVSCARYGSEFYWDNSVYSPICQQHAIATSNWYTYSVTVTYTYQ